MGLPANAQTNPVSIESIKARVVIVIKEYDVAVARQEAQTMTERLGFKRTAIYEIATSVTELATNLYFHTPHGGAITARALNIDGRIGLEIIALDEGPGIPNIEEALQDGFTTNRGLGSGLPGVGRLMDELKIESSVDLGTHIIARKWRRCP